MPPALRLVARLRDDGVLDPRLARSVYRKEAFNRRAGGAKGSEHLSNIAIDFDLPRSEHNVAQLWAFWREHGPAQNIRARFLYAACNSYRYRGLSHVGQRSYLAHIVMQQNAAVDTNVVSQKYIDAFS